MSYISHLSWKRDPNTTFTAKSYDRTHTIQFGGGAQMTASSAPEYLGKADLPNPEELFTAAIGSCFMLTFLYWAAMKNLPIINYQAECRGTLAKNAEGKMAVTEVIIKPSLTFQDNQPVDTKLVQECLQKAHEHCFISSSVKSQVKVTL
jgi:organic hydroperoxide reductase OsmC/OhrA